MGIIIQKGIKYGEGKDGFSPVVTVTNIENGHKVDVRDINGVKSFEVLNGADGIDAPCDGLMFTSLEELRLTAPTTVGEVFNAMPDKSILMLNVEAIADDGNVRTVTDVPKDYGILTIEKHSASRHRIEYSSSLGGSASDVRKWIGSIKGNDGTGLRWIEITGSAKVYTTMAQLGLDGATATVQDVIDKVAIGEIAMLRTDAFNNDNWKTQCNNIQYGYLKIEKTQNGLSNIELQEVVVPNRRYFGTQSSGKFVSWVAITNTTGLVNNAQNFKINLTKNNASWYGMFTFNFVYGTTPCEITVTISDKVYYTITQGQNLVSALTYTQDGANYIIGIDLTAKVYGTQVIEMSSEFGAINSLTAETFAGTTAAILKGYGGKTYTNLSELGLTANATLDDAIVKLGAGQNATINTTEFTNYKTLFPYSEEQDAYATVHIEKGHDINGSRTIVKWVRKDASKVAYGGLGSNNKVTWWNEYALKSYVDSKHKYSTGEVAIGTWIDGKTIYRKTFTKSPTSNQSTGNQVTIDVATISGLTNVIDIQATAKLYNYNSTSAPIYAKIPFGEIWRSNSGYSGAYVDSVYVEGTTLKIHANSCTSDDIYYITVEYTK